MKPRASFFLLKERPINGMRWISTIINPRLAEGSQTLNVIINNKKRMHILLDLSHKYISTVADCQTKLLEQWGVKDQQKLTNKPIPITNPLKRLNSSDFPFTTRVGNKRELVTFKVEVDEKGAGGKCTILAPSKIMELNQALCRIIDEDKNYKPALNANGGAVSATYVQSV